MKSTIFVTVLRIEDQGGVSTSIQNLLNEIHGFFDVTLCSLEDYISPNIIIPENVKIVKGSSLIGDSIINRNLLSGHGVSRWLRVIFARILRNFLGMSWIIRRGIRGIALPEFEYDVAIAFSGNRYRNGVLEEGGEYEFIVNHIKAKRKVAWIHNDLNALGFTHDICIDQFKNMNAIVSVSLENKQQLEKLVPEYRDKCYVVYNTYNIRKIKEQSREGGCPYSANKKLHFVTVARLDIKQKRQDRIIKVCRQLKQEGFVNFEWYLVGGGDALLLTELIKENGVEDIVKIVGIKTNPYPYMSYADAFVLTSQYEGYGMTVKEAQILNCPTLVTNFGPAHEAVKDGLEGCICDNSTQGVYNMMKRVVENPNILMMYRGYLKDHPINNNIAIKQFYQACGLVD